MINTDSAYRSVVTQSGHKLTRTPSLERKEAFNRFNGPNTTQFQ